MSIEGVKRGPGRPRIRVEGNAESETSLQAARFAEAPAERGGGGTDDARGGDVVQPVAVPETPPAGWYGMDDAPDCRLIYLIGDRGQLVEAIWRNSRRIDRRNGKWQPFSYWAIANSGGMAVPWTPIGWKPGDQLYG